MISEYNIGEQTIRRLRGKQAQMPSVWIMFRDEQFRDRRLLQAVRAEYWRNAQGQKCWFFHDYREWELDDKGLLTGPARTGKIREVSPDELSLQPQDIRHARDENMLLTTAQIMRRWQRDPQYRRLGVLANARLAFPFLNIILLSLLAGLSYSL